MVLGIVIPDGVGIKNYLYTHFPKFFLAEKDNSIVLFHIKLDDELLQEITAPYGNQMTLVPLPLYQEDLKSRIIREAIALGRLKYFTEKLNNHTIIHAAPLATTWRKKMLLSISAFFGNAMSKHYNRIVAWEKKYAKRLASIDVQRQINILTQNKVDVMFSLHQRPLENIPMYEAARRLNLRRCAVIYSWDNVAKARLYTAAEKYFLWSKYMHDQMQLFYPEITADQLVVTGTPQFSFYFNEAYQSTRTAFCNKWNLDEHRPIILFTGSDLRTSPYDPWLLRDVAEALLTYPEQQRPQLIFRRTPADFSTRYDWVLAQYSWIIKMDPIWLNIGNSWATVIPTKRDLRNVVALIQHCAIVINVASTMALDAATHHKPCIYLSYHPAEARAKGEPLYNATHDEDHFKVMKNIDAVVYINQEDQLTHTIQSILTDSSQFATGKEKYLEIITDNLHTSAEQNLANEIMKLTPNNK
jgi:hypothetical protein